MPAGTAPGDLTVDVGAVRRNAKKLVPVPSVEFPAPLLRAGTALVVPGPKTVTGISSIGVTATIATSTPAGGSISP